MKINKLMYVATVALMASGMALAQSSTSTSTSTTSSTMDSQAGSSTATAPQTGGHTDTQSDLPAVKEGEKQSGASTQSDSQAERPGAMGTPSTPNEGMTPKGETPATGVQTEQKGKSDKDDMRPGATPSEPATNGTDTNSTPKSMSSNPDSANKPDYAKPITITSTDSSTDSKAAENSPDSGTQSPK
ncbi:MAG TPA: hypothetical protein VM578_12870 [Candidatus Saccharimonadales bacterium]|nr:hypothetical protein [Candidatus Saccharimonadales bacterium]